MPREIQVSEPVAARRRVYFDLRDGTDGLTPELSEANGQPQLSTNGGAWTNTGIGILVVIGNGRYYAELTVAAVSSTGAIIETRYKSAATAESPGDTIEVVTHDPVADIAAVRAKTDTLGSGTVTVVSPIAGDLSIEIIEGDDYVAADARAFEFTNVAGTWPDLTDATPVTFTARHKSAGSNRFSVNGSVITPTGPNQKISFDVLKATTDKLKDGKYDYIVTATLASGNIVTLVRSDENVLTLKSDLVQG